MIANGAYHYRHYHRLEASHDMDCDDDEIHHDHHHGVVSQEGRALVGAGNSECTIEQRVTLLCCLYRQSMKKVQNEDGTKVAKVSDIDDKDRFRLFANPNFLQSNFKGLLVHGKASDKLASSSKGNNSNTKLARDSQNATASTTSSNDNRNTIKLVLLYGCHQDVVECHVLARNKGITDIQAKVGGRIAGWLDPMEDDNGDYGTTLDQVMELSKVADKAQHYSMTKAQWNNLRIHRGVSECACNTHNCMSILTFHDRDYIDVYEIMRVVYII